MTDTLRAFRATLLGAAAFVGMTAATSLAQDSSLVISDIDERLDAEGFIDIDLDGGGADFRVELIQPPQLFPTEIGDGLPVATFIDDPLFLLPPLDPGQQAIEIALIRTANPLAMYELQGDTGGIVARLEKLQSTPFAATFGEGDIVGEFGREFTVSSALLYYDTVDEEGIRRSFGPFSETGDTGFVGLSVTSMAEGGEFVNNFGFLEITRGSVIIGQQGFQEAPFTGAQIGAVPLPAPIAFLAFAVLGLFGLRRFKA